MMELLIVGNSLLMCAGIVVAGFVIAESIKDLATAIREHRHSQTDETPERDGIETKRTDADGTT